MSLSGEPNQVEPLLMKAGWSDFRIIQIAAASVKAGTKGDKSSIRNGKPSVDQEKIN
jgi:hypothetical protein